MSEKLISVEKQNLGFVSAGRSLRHQRVQFKKKTKELLV